MFLLLLNISTWTNNIGIFLEIAGFIIILLAVKAVKPGGGGSFTSQWDIVGNVMSTLHSRWNYAGIVMVIFGLILQFATL